MGMSSKFPFCVPVAAGIVSGFMGNHEIVVIMMLLGALPPSLQHPPIAIVHLYAIAGKFPFQVCRGIAIRPRPQWRKGWRKGGDHQLKRGFLQSKKDYAVPASS